MIFENALIVVNQVLILFLLIGVGYLFRKLKMIDDNGIRQLTNLLLMIITPCIIIRSFQTPFDPTLLRGMGIAMGFAILSHVIGALVARPFFRRQPDPRRKVLEFSVVFSNCGFMCIPLLAAVLGERGVFYGSIYITVFNVAQWTYGVLLMTGSRKNVSLVKSLVNPGTVTVLIAIPIFILSIQLPTAISVVVDYLADTNTPLAMIVIGAQMAVVSLKNITKDRPLLVATGLRLLVVPALVMLILSLLPLDRVLVLSCLIPAAAPTAAAAGLFSTRYRQDTALATQMIALTTLLSIISIPVLILISDLLA